MLVDLIDAFDAARKPFLIKCSGGQDRTSLAAALYLLHRNGWDGAWRRPQQQFARWPYLHLPKTEQRWLRQFVDFAEEDAKGASLADWLRNGYEPERFRDWLVAQRARRILQGHLRETVARPQLAVVKPLTLAPGVTLWRGYFARDAQRALVDTVFALAADAPFYTPVMPKTGKPFSVEEFNFGPLGWVSEIGAYRYAPTHPVTGKPWPAMPPALRDLWHAVAGYPAPPQCCLVNLYRASAKMGPHQDRDEAADAPVVSVSLGDDALFRFGGTTRKGPTQSIMLSSGDVLTFGGVARLMFHGVDRIAAGSSRLVPGGGRINLTLRRVAK